MTYRSLPLLTLGLILSATAPAFAVTSAELYRAQGVGYGKFEARVMFAAGDGIISSFFLWKDGSELSTAYWNELDFEKLGAACELQSNSIYGDPETTHEKHHPNLLGLCEGYHTYTYEWTPEYIVWKLDGVELRRDVGADATAYAENATEKGLQVRFNIWPGNANFGGNFTEASLPAYQYIEWAQYSAYTPGAGDEGSDFTFSWREEFEAMPAGWSTGSWDSPLGLSTHSSANVVFADGVAVLALTADDATGYTGTPPVDPNNMGGATGVGGAPATSGGAPVTSGGQAATSGGAGSAVGGSSVTPPTRFASGCSYGGSSTPFWPLGLAAWALTALFARAGRFAKPSLRSSNV
jgi:endo-1,3-1,4-beta-glycanase ExoK